MSNKEEQYLGQDYDNSFATPAPKPVESALPPVSDGSEYSQMRRDVNVHGKRESALRRAEKALRFSNVMSETVTSLATSFPKPEEHVWDSTAVAIALDIADENAAG